MRFLNLFLPVFSHQTLLLLFSLLFCWISAVPAAASSSVWTDVDPSSVVPRGQRDIVPSSYRVLKLDRVALGETLSRAPMALSPEAETSPLTLELPLPDGTFGRFEVEEAPIMERPLAEKYPQIKTFRGQGLDDPSATLRFDLTPKGFHALVLTAEGSVWIDPYQRYDDELHIVYRGRDHHREDETFHCDVHGQVHGEIVAGTDPAAKTDSTDDLGLPSHGGTLRTYRIAVAATGEYTAFHSAGTPTVAEGLAAVVTAMNRVNGIYERTLSMTMVLVANNDRLIYTDGGTDPYNNSNNVDMMLNNENVLNAEIGLANYDIGHVVGTTFGGVAIRLVPCTMIKARGASGHGNPINDGFWIRVLSHEIGHQWGANHTFNGDGGSCFGSQRNPDTAFEPGSGSTIMSYAGLCGSQDLQAAADDYYHAISLEEIVDYAFTADGSTCGTATATGNGVPTVEAGPSYTIPVDTPFELCGSGSDPDGHALTFNWEQFNLGPAGAPGAPVMDAPIFRSRPPGESPCRTFPRLSDLLAGTTSVGELLPSYARTLSFRLTARDNQAVGGAFAMDETSLVVSDQAGPFRVTAPAGAVVWQGGASEDVTWDVAGTASAPVSCAAVDILLSVDGGSSFAHVLADDTANDGGQSISVPQDATTQGRIKVVCSDNVFFNVSDQNLTIEESVEIFADGFESGDTGAWN